jgi:hypothetical protein
LTTLFQVREPYPCGHAMTFRCPRPLAVPSSSAAWLEPPNAAF